jgi:hypothetical protein
MSFIQKILDNARRQGRATPKGENGTQDATLSVSASDAGWSAKLVDGDGVRWQRRACGSCFSRPKSGAMLDGWESATAITTKKEASSAVCWTGCGESPRMGNGLARYWPHR